MSDLLAIGRSGVIAYQSALASVGENVVNADTDGYARRAVVLKEQSSASGAYTLNRTVGAFDGVQAAQVSRVWDQYKAANAWSSASDASRASTRADALSSVEATLGSADADLGTKLTAVFNSGTQLASDTADATLRQTMLATIGDAAAGFRQTDADLAKAGGVIRTQALTLVDGTNDQLAVLAKVNVALHTTPGGTAAHAQLEDQRDTIIGSLAANVSLDVALDADGAASLQLGDGGGPALLGATGPAARLGLVAGTDGRLAMRVEAGGAATAAIPTGGAIAGLIDVAATVAGRRQQLDALASQFTTQLNDWQHQGLTPDGNAGADLLSGTTAADIALVSDDPAAIAAANATDGDGGNLATLDALRGDDGVEAKWSTIVTGQSLLVASAKSESDAAKARGDGAAAATDEVSGVDLDTEAAQLLRYQQAYSASAKVIQTARQTLQSILDLF